MEILPRLWIDYYGNNLNYIKKKKIKNIIHLSKSNNYIKKHNIEEINIVIDYDDNNTYEEQNMIMYQQLFDITDYIHEKIINNESILLLGDEFKQDIDTIIIAYYIRYGKLNIYDSILFLKTKKSNIFYPKCLFYFALNKFYNQLNKNY
jgi:hypothetical protein